jgi:hypothetical protein
MYKCDRPGCKFTHEKPQGITAHKSAAHLTPEQNAARVAKRLATIRANKEANLEAIKPTKVSKVVKPSADDIFERVEKATKILFPDPKVFYERFEEVAELRRQMLRAIQ